MDAVGAQQRQDQQERTKKQDQQEDNNKIKNKGLAAYPAGPDGLVFTGERGQPVARALHRAWRQAIVAAQLPGDTTWHMLRHTYASVLIDGGESVTVVARRLGHASPSETLRTYSHLWPDSDERTRQVVEAAFGRAARTAITDRRPAESLGDG